jgi:superfamily II DNA or RNA helicase
MKSDSALIAPGARVFSKAHPEFGFGVVKMRDENALGEVVFHASFDHTDRPVLLPPEDAEPVPDATEDLRAGRLGPAAVFRRKLAAGMVLTENNRNGAFLKVSTQPLPHQAFVLDKILSSNRFGHVLADDVGMGKTIEAGLLIASVLRERRDGRVLIVCPKGLAVQWKDEMDEHFGIPFAVMGDEFKGKLPSSWQHQSLVIAPIDRLKRDDYEEALRQAGVFDLVVCDEAHKLSASRGLFSQKLEKTANYRLFERLVAQRSIKFIAGNDGAPRSPRLLLLSATPHQGDDERFLYLLNLARPDLFPMEREATETLLIPSALVETITRTPKSRAVHWDGRPIFKGHETHTLTVAWTESEKEASLALTRYIQSSLAQASPAAALIVQLVMHTFHKIAASSWIALAQTLARRLAALQGQATPLLADGDEDEDEETLPTDATDGAKALPFFQAEATALAQLIAQVEVLEIDSKWECCAELLREVEAQEPGAKVLFFTQYRATQELLVARLATLFPGAEAVLIHGDIPTEERKAARLAFETHARFLVSTEAGGEGINLQKACHLMLNYDLPWNPMRLQQRIGRLDRYGQREKVRVFNLLVAASWDQHISTRILERLASIQASMGVITADAEDYREMLLGAVADQINPAQLFARSASGEESVSDTQIDGWVRNAFASMDRWKQVFSRDLGMPENEIRLAPQLSSDDLRAAFALAAEGHGIKLMETRTSESRFVEGVYHFRRPAAFRGRTRGADEVYVAFDRDRYAEVRGEVLGKARGQEIRPALAGFGDELTDWMFETVFPARAGESAFAVRAGERWPHGRGVLWVWALRWLGTSRRLKSPDAIVVCFQRPGADPFLVSPREAMALTADCDEATPGSQAVPLDPEPARRLAQAELRGLLTAKDPATRGAAALSLLLAATVV